MPQYIVCIKHEGTPYFLNHSTIEDAPRSYGLPRKEFLAWWTGTYGWNERHIESRLDEAERRGTDSPNHRNAASTLHSNRAGDGEERLTMAQIIDRFIVNRPANAHKKSPYPPEDG